MRRSIVSYRTACSVGFDIDVQTVYVTLFCTYCWFLQNTSSHYSHSHFWELPLDSGRSPARLSLLIAISLITTSLINTTFPKNTIPINTGIIIAFTTTITTSSIIITISFTITTSYYCHHHHHHCHHYYHSRPLYHHFHYHHYHSES